MSIVIPRGKRRNTKADAYKVDAALYEDTAQLDWDLPDDEFPEELEVILDRYYAASKHIDKGSCTQRHIDDMVAFGEQAMSWIADYYKQAEAA